MIFRPRRRSRKHGRDSASTVPFWNDPSGVSPAAFLLACLVFVAAMLLGGNGGSFGDTIVQLLALPLIVLAAMHWTVSPLRSRDRIALCILGGIVVLAVVQLIPLPLSWWAGLPGRADLLRDMQSVGVTPRWHSISLNPFATERALQWTLPAIAMFLAVRWMSLQQRTVMLVILFVGSIALLILGIASHGAPQNDAVATANAVLAKTNLALTTVQAPSDASTADQSVAGLFSNRNHFATLLVMTLPLVAAIAITIWRERTKGKSKALIPWAVLLLMVILGLLVGMFETRSRAGLVLGGLSVVGSLALLRDLGLNRQLVRALIACTLIGALLALELSASDAISRVDVGPAVDTRALIHATTLHAAHRFGPLGSGLGTFVQAYQAVDQQKDVAPYFINRAHGDYHELWLETGVPGALLMATFMAWFGWSSWRAWRHIGKHRAVTLIARAATISIALLLLHSAVDYPLRKTTILVVFGMCCALLSSTVDAKVRTVEATRAPGPEREIGQSMMGANR